MRLLTVLAVATLLQAEPGWTPAGTKDGVTLSYRDDQRLDAREVRAVAELPFAADRITSLVCDFTQPLDPGVRERRVLSGEVAGRYEIYLRYAPQYVIVSARDVVLDVTRHAGGCSWSELADRMPPQPGAVRMPLLRGSWAVDAIDERRSRVTYQFAVRPGGSVPSWMVRRGAAGALPGIIARVSKLLESAR